MYVPLYTNYVFLFSTVYFSTIDRAAGKSSHEKLLVFYYALKAAKLDNIAQAAEVALSRLGEVLE